MNLRTLMSAYRGDPISGFYKLEYCTRRYYDRLMKQLAQTWWIAEDSYDCHCAAFTNISTINGRRVFSWHREWTGGDQKISMGHALVGMLRTLVNFGDYALDDKDCERVANILHKMRFANGKPRTVQITREQATAICNAARPRLPMIALAQALQFECTWRQKDVIGEWLPIGEPGLSDVCSMHPKKGPMKWLKGLWWEEIDADLVVHHITSKRKKLSEPDLKLAPLVMAELEHMWPGFIRLGAAVDHGREMGALGSPPKYPSFNRSALPASGPVIIDEYTGFPYKADDFREEWRIIATECGVPLNVQNRDARAGAISEAIMYGADAMHVRDAATHSDVSQTADYSRASRENTHTVQRMRMEKSSEKVA
jgi:hypothetical protein